MDDITQLPLKKGVQLTPQEDEVMRQFFPTNQNQVPLQGAQKANLNWKLIGSTALLFVVLANPWIDMAICKIPYCGDNVLLLLLLKLMLFVIIYIMLSIYIK